MWDCCPNQTWTSAAQNFACPSNLGAAEKPVTMASGELKWRMDFTKKASSFSACEASAAWLLYLI